LKKRNSIKQTPTTLVHRSIKQTDFPPAVGSVAFASLPTSPYIAPSASPARISHMHIIIYIALNASNNTLVCPTFDASVLRPRTVAPDSIFPIPALSDRISFLAWLYRD
jgi:hypothetical protein